MALPNVLILERQHSAALASLEQRLEADRASLEHLQSDVADMGTTLDTLRSFAVPRGLIALWSGVADTIPDGWHLCDGTNGTPDMRDRFIYGAGGDYVPGVTGGSAAFTASATVGATTLSVAQMPSHGHGTNAEYAQGVPHETTGTYGPSYREFRTASVYGAGSSGSHTHTLSTISGSTLPPFLTLCYIMKL